MSSRTRAIVLAITAPVVAFAIVGGVLGTVMAREDTYQHLKIFDDVVSLISSNYVEPVNIDKVMRGAMNGLVDSLDPDSAYLSPDEVKQAESGSALPAGDLGIELTRQYYLRVLAARDNSPAAKAGLRTGDYVRAINDVPTRDMSVWQGMRALRGAVGSKVTLTIFRGNAADPHVVTLTREALAPARRVRTNRDARRRIRPRSRDRPAHGRSGEVAGRRRLEERRHEAGHRRPPDRERHLRSGPRAGAPLRRQRHAGAAGNQGRRRRRTRLPPTRATAASACRPSC